MRGHLPLPATTLLSALLLACHAPGDARVHNASAQATGGTCDASGASCRVFRATGNEPGWMAELMLGEAPTLHAELDYGARRFDVTAVTQGKDGWGGTAADGTTLALSVTPGGCTDTMSGQRFAATARLAVGGKVYQGCG
jgi:uncharacterized membrane protein